ncbi:MAG: hypothetical protein ACOYJ6_10335 [Caulobacterales bacterium]|jgi:hypothetical protein
MRPLLLALCLTLTACITPPELEIDAAQGDEIVIRAGAFKGRLDADKLAEQACSGDQTVLLDLFSKPGDTENTYYRYRCLRLPQALKR